MVVEYRADLYLSSLCWVTWLRPNVMENDAGWSRVIPHNERTVRCMQSRLPTVSTIARINPPKEAKPKQPANQARKLIYFNRHDKSLGPTTYRIDPLQGASSPQRFWDRGNATNRWLICLRHLWLRLLPCPLAQ